jgi:hypothetical protein
VHDFAFAAGNGVEALVGLPGVVRAVGEFGDESTGDGGAVDALLPEGRRFLRLAP